MSELNKQNIHKCINKKVKGCLKGVYFLMTYLHFLDLEELIRFLNRICLLTRQNERKEQTGMEGRIGGPTLIIEKLRFK